MLRTPSFVPIYVFPIIVIRGRRPCVHKNLRPHNITASVLSINHGSSFHTIHTRSTAHSPSCTNDWRTITQSWTRFCHMMRKCVFLGEGFIKASWLYMIWHIKGMWSCFYDLSDLEIRRILLDQTSLKLTKIFKEGSASARRPAVTQAVAPPTPIISTSCTTQTV